MSKLKRVYLMPSLPHILHKAEANQGYQELSKAAASLRDDMNAAGVERLVFFSTSWIAVLGQMVLGGAHAKGTHVDENWYDYGSLPFDVTVDEQFSKGLVEAFKGKGMGARLIDYDCFPVDTGTIVAHSLLGTPKIKASLVANHVYADFAKSKLIANLVRSQIESGNDNTAAIVVSGLSQRYFTRPIDLREDAISDPADDRANKKMLNLFKDGSYQAAEDMVSAYAQQTKADMGFKALAWMRGLLGDDYKTPAQVLAYAPIYGTGAAVVSCHL